MEVACQPHTSIIAYAQAVRNTFIQRNSPCPRSKERANHVTFCSPRYATSQQTGLGLGAVVPGRWVGAVARSHRADHNAARAGAATGQPGPVVCLHVARAGHCCPAPAVLCCGWPYLLALPLPLRTRFTLRVRLAGAGAGAAALALLSALGAGPPMRTSPLMASPVAGFIRWPLFSRLR